MFLVVLKFRKLKGSRSSVPETVCVLYFYLREREKERKREKEEMVKLKLIFQPHRKYRYRGKH